MKNEESKITKALEQSYRLLLKRKQQLKQKIAIMENDKIKIIDFAKNNTKEH